jgi:hypothetical protein
MNVDFGIEARVGDVYLADIMVTAERLDTRENILGLLCRNVYDQWCVQTITHCVPVDPDTIKHYDY